MGLECTPSAYDAQACWPRLGPPPWQVLMSIFWFLEGVDGGDTEGTATVRCSYIILLARTYTLSSVLNSWPPWRCLNPCFSSTAIPPGSVVPERRPPPSSGGNVSRIESLRVPTIHSFSAVFGISHLPPSHFPGLSLCRELLHQDSWLRYHTHA